MKAMIRGAASIVGALALSAAFLPPAALPAQAAEDVPRLMIVPFRGNEKGLGSQAAEAVRTRVASDVSVKKLAVIAKSTVCANLEASGFSCDSVPDQLTSRLLANSLRAETYLEGNITKVGNAYKLETRFFISGFPEMSQPLPDASGTKLGDLAAQVSKSFQAARQEVPEFANCMHALGRKAYPEAIKAANAAIAIYPPSTVARVCLAKTWVEQEAPSDSIIAIANKVVELDPRNISALLIIGAEYKKHGQKFRQDGQTDSANAAYRKAVEAWSQVITIDPHNVARAAQIVNEIGSSGQAPAAKPIIIKAVADNPGDPDLIKLEWQILLATRDTADMRQATVIGEDMVKVDTAAADTTFFVRQAAAYAELRDSKAAVATTTAGLNKFPQTVTLWSLCAKVQSRAGNAQGSLDCAMKLVQLDSTNAENYILIARAQADLQHVDLAVAAIRSALKPPGGGTTTPSVTAQAGQLLLIFGSQAYKAANAANPQNKNDYKRAVSLLAYADSVQPTPQAKFLMGISAFKIGDADVRENVQAKKCDLAKEASDYLLMAQLNIAAGGSVDPNTAKQLLAGIQQYGPSVEGQTKKYCK